MKKGDIIRLKNFQSKGFGRRDKVTPPYSEYIFIRETEQSVICTDPNIGGEFTFSKELIINDKG